MFTINIGVNPLFAQKVNSVKELYNYMRVCDLMLQKDTWWAYTDESVIEVSGIIIDCILPFFEQCKTYEGMLKFYEKLISIRSAGQDSNDFAISAISVIPFTYILGEGIITGNDTLIFLYIQTRLDYYEYHKNTTPTWYDDEIAKSINDTEKNIGYLCGRKKYRI